MPKHGPIILIEDDEDDHYIFLSVLQDLGIQNKLVWFTSAVEAMPYLKTTTDHPFLIFCDINLPKMSGIEFKQQIDEDHELRKKNIPFLFYSTSADKYATEKAYCDMTVQGFFEKGINYTDIKKKVELIVGYWTICKHPND